MTTAFADLEQLWHEHHTDLTRYARRYVGADRAEDVTQDVFCNALKAMLNGKGYNDSARGWLFRILRNLLIDHWRATRHTQLASWEVLPEYVDEYADPAVVVACQTETERLHHAITALPARQMDVAAMRLGGYGYEEIAEHVGCSHGAAKALMARAYANLREQLPLLDVT